MSNCYVTLEQLSLCYIVIAIPTRMNNIKVKYNKVFSIFLDTLSINYKTPIRDKIKLFKLFNFAVHQIQII